MYNTTKSLVSSLSIWVWDWQRNLEVSLGNVPCFNVGPSEYGVRKASAWHWRWLQEKTSRLDWWRRHHGVGWRLDEDEGENAVGTVWLHCSRTSCQNASMSHAHWIGPDLTIQSRSFFPSVFFLFLFLFSALFLQSVVPSLFFRPSTYSSILFLPFWHFSSHSILLFCPLFFSLVCLFFMQSNVSPLSFCPSSASFLSFSLCCVCLGILHFPAVWCIPFFPEEPWRCCWGSIHSCSYAASRLPLWSLRRRTKY